MLEIVFLIAGFVLLIKGADIFVDASVGIAKKLKIPSIVIGLTIVAMGTSAPEAVVSITAGLKGSNELAIGNVVGSNIFNLLLIIGLCALIKPFKVKFKEMAKDFVVSIAAALILLVIMILSKDYIPRLYALLLLAVFAVYMITLIRQALKGKETSHENTETIKLKPLPLSIFLAVLGCALVIIGGQVTVNSAVNIASALGISERIIGLTVVAAGTSLPELVTSLIACRKNENDIALGNVVGSNIFNILFILGIAGLVKPLAIDINLISDLIMLLLGSLITLLFIYTGKKVVRLEGMAMVMMYTAYVVFICVQ